MIASLLLTPVGARAQAGQYGPAHIEIGAQATGVVTLESPAIHGRDLTEGDLTQPLLMAMASFWGDALQRELATWTGDARQQAYVWGVQLSGGHVFASDMLNGIWKLTPASLPPG